MKSQYLIFNVSKENYIIELTEVREVINSQEYEKVPNAESHVLGLLNLRGEIVTVIDSSVILNANIKDIKSKENKIIIFEYNNEKIGLLVEKVSRVIEIDSSEIDQSTLTESSYVSGLVHRNGNLFIIVDINKTILNQIQEIA